MKGLEMEIYKVEKLNFSYPKSDPVLINAGFSMKEGEFVTLCGESGCGKSTLLRLLKPGIEPFGKITGDILWKGEPISKLSAEDSAKKIGFVLQNPESGIVTDKVWHELAFSLESTGTEAGIIRRRISEMTCYFGLEDVFEKDTAALSGGQKQLLSLASAAALHPEIMLLDEPASMLDPISARNFIDALKRLNVDFGISVLIAEHRLEELFPISDKILVMDKGKIILECAPEEAASALPENHPIREALPCAARLYYAAGGKGKAPVTIKEGRNSKECYSFLKSLKSRCPEPVGRKIKGKEIISASNIRFGYGRDKDVLQGISFKVYKGEIYFLLGGNGSGKTTLLKILAGILKPSGGKARIEKGERTAYLPQNPCALFEEETVREELNGEDRYNLVPKEIYDRNPYDISGGERQLTALAKLLNKEPSILLLDEPTKGMDASAKISFSKLLMEAAKRGTSIIAASHDTELAARCADYCGLLFNGEITSEDVPEKFFGGNYFYTTPLSRLSRGIAENVISLDRIGDNFHKS